jgi:hypothetical protein
MAKSTQVITDLKAATTTAFTAVQELRAASPADPVTPFAQLMGPQSLEGQCSIALVKAQELLKLLNDLLTDPDGAGGQTKALVRSGEANFVVLDSVRQVLV